MTTVTVLVRVADGSPFALQFNLQDATTRDGERSLQWCEECKGFHERFNGGSVHVVYAREWLREVIADAIYAGDEEQVKRLRFDETLDAIKLLSDWMSGSVEKEEAIPPQGNPELEAEERAHAATLQRMQENIDVIQATLSYLMRTGTDASARTLADLALWHAREIENLIASRQLIESGDELPF